MLTRCSVVDCVFRKKSSEGYCQKHLRRYKLYGDANKLIKQRDKKCLIENCNNKHHSLGYCQKHFYRFRLYGDPLKLTKSKNKTCIIENCDKKHRV